MKKLKSILIDLKQADVESKLKELTDCLEDDWVIVNQSMMDSAVIYLIAKVPEELVKKFTLNNIIK